MTERRLSPSKDPASKDPSSEDLASEAFAPKDLQRPPSTKDAAGLDVTQVAARRGGVDAAARDRGRPTDAGSLPERQISLESVLADILERQEAGQRVVAQDEIERFPQWAEPLKSFFRNDRWLRAPSDSHLESESEGPTSLAGEMIDDYQLLREIARGGMGVVYEAVQLSLRRTVAVKLIGEGVLANDELRIRFRMEAEAAANLSHPNILPIHAIGCWRGLDYFVMPLVDGPSLQSAVGQRGHALQQADLSPSDNVAAIRQAIEWVRDIARGLAHAHRRGIIHRDLKPENVLLADGEPKVVDFGLAKWHRDEPQLTREGQVMGTPHYMSPEQARGWTDITAASDIYSLGGILFALLVGRSPHQGDSLAEVLASVLDTEPPSLRLLWPGGMPRIAELNELEAILSRAMAGDRQARYRTADDLADDLDCCLRGDSPRAAPDRLLDRVGRELRRDHHQAAFRNWGRALRRIGVIVFLAHVVMFSITWSRAPSLQGTSIAAASPLAWWGYFLPRLAMLIGIAAVIQRARDGVWFPQVSAERPVWSIWLGYLATLTLVNAFWWAGVLDHAEVMMLACVMSGFAFFAMAGHVWGGSAIIGGGFFVAATACVVWPGLSALFLGTMWLAAMWILAKRY